MFGIQGRICILSAVDASPLPRTCSIHLATANRNTLPVLACCLGKASSQRLKNNGPNP